MKISIITPSFNSVKTIEDTIRSVQDQNYNDIEHIVIDGGSTDGTVDIIKKHENHVAKWVSEPDSGIYDAMNKGITMATGEVVGMLNSDDKFFDVNSIQKIANAFSDREVDCCFGNLVFEKENGAISRRWHSKPFVPGLFLKSWTPAHPTFYCKKELYLKYGLYKTNYRIASDVELMLRFLEKHRISSFFINEYLVKMLPGGVSNQAVNSTVTITKELIRAHRENNLNFRLLKYLFYKAGKLKEFI